MLCSSSSLVSLPHRFLRFSLTLVRRSSLLADMLRTRSTVGPSGVLQWDCCSQLERTVVQCSDVVLAVVPRTALRSRLQCRRPLITSWRWHLHYGCSSAWHYWLGKQQRSTVREHPSISRSTVHGLPTVLMLHWPLRARLYATQGEAAAAVFLKGSDHHNCLLHALLAHASRLHVRTVVYVIDHCYVHHGVRRQVQVAAQHMCCC